MFHAYLIKYGEIAIKGSNRHVFEDALLKQIRFALAKIDGEFEVYKTQGRAFVECKGDYDNDEVTDALSRVFGIVGICPMVKIEDMDFENLKKEVVAYMGRMYPEGNKTFKVMARRAEKRYPKQSMEINADLGEAILEAYPTFKVDVHKPEIQLQVEVRENIYIYSETIPGPGGMPIGTAGKAMLLLSGGIDSPVAGYMVAKRGVQLEAVYFNAPPYTSERAQQKVVDLAKQVAKYAGPIRLYDVNFTEIQLAIYEKCPHDELTIIMRRYMMRIAEYLARKDECLGMVTGESIGQVASQTMQSLACTDDACGLPVYRPVIGFDKTEIIERSQKIGTYETSILPYEDCCTIFVAKHPVTKPNLEKIRKSEKKLEDCIDEMFQRAIDTVNVINIR